MIHQDVTPVTREEVEAAVASDDPLRRNFALVCATMTMDDWPWVEYLVPSLIAHEDAEVRRVCATCVGHLARTHRKLDLRRVMPALETMRHTDPTVDVRGTAEDVLADMAEVWHPAQTPT